MDLTTPKARSGLARIITNLFDLWGVTANESLRLLGLSPNSRASLARYRAGKPLPNRPDVLNRVGYLLAIHKSLGLLFPANTEIKSGWIKMKNKAFENSTPLDLMFTEGLEGIVKTYYFLDVLINNGDLDLAEIVNARKDQKEIEVSLDEL